MARDLQTQMLSALPRRKDSGRWGIGTADVYLRSIEGCLEGSAMCPHTAFNMASPTQWRRAIKAAGHRLVYCDPGQVIDGEKSGDGLFRIKTPDSGVPKGALLAFDCVLTSRKQDRDGDILDPLGAKPDEMMPLLWQHLPMEPIGRFVKLLGTTDNNVRARFAVAPTQLGEDVVKLIEFGALRISHGFRPLKYEPIFSDKQGINHDEEPFEGFMVHSYEILEGSTVSVPSNTDAVITGFSRDKFHHPAVKSWAGNFYAERPVMIAVGKAFEVPDDKEKPESDEDEDESEGKPEDKPKEKPGKTGKPTCQCGGKTEADPKATPAVVKGIADAPANDEDEPVEELPLNPAKPDDASPTEQALKLLATLLDGEALPDEVRELMRHAIQMLSDRNGAVTPKIEEPKDKPEDKPKVSPPNDKPEKSAVIDGRKQALVELLSLPYEDVLKYVREVQHLAAVRQRQFDDEEWSKLESELPDQADPSEPDGDDDIDLDELADDQLITL
jgi:hypothetical protein